MSAADGSRRSATSQIARYVIASSPCTMGACPVQRAETPLLLRSWYRGGREHLAVVGSGSEDERQADGKTDYRVRERKGRVYVLRQPPLEAGAGPVTRLRELVESLLPGH